MEKETKPILIEADKPLVENMNLPEDGELPDDELDTVSGGQKAGGLISNVQKTRAEIAMTFARNARA